MAAPDDRGSRAAAEGFDVLFERWERDEDRWVKFSSLPDGKGPGGFLNGNILVTFDNYDNTSSEEIIIYDTSRFPTAGG